MVSLVNSSLLYLAHVKVLAPKELRILNGMYMRVVQKIGGNSRYDDTAVSDFTARQCIGVPSIDCLVMKSRLRYYGGWSFP